MNTEYKNRIKNVQNAIIQSQADACIITTAVNQFYLFGFIFDGYAYILPNDEPILFVKRPENIENAIYIRKPEQIPDFLCNNGLSLPKKVLIEADRITLNNALRLQNALENPQLLNVSGIMREIRSVKSEYELSEMRKCAAIQTDVYRQIPSLYQKGMTDVLFQTEVERVMRQHGSIGIFRAFGDNMDIFMGSVLAGDNAQAASAYDFAMGGKGVSPYLPIGASDVKLEDGMTIMFDMAGNFLPYMSDMTRTFAIGKVDKKAYDAHQVSIEMNEWVSENVKPGTHCADIYYYSLETAKKYNLENYFMGTTQQAKFVGHGLGLEINEPPVFTPRSKEILRPNIAFAYEPKFVLPGIGAVGIENTFIINENGVEKITLCEEEMIVL
ncbi:MAG: Xaa-Pro peptidase family protein [Dysgonamonadaceae bacterium]|jgi:Xaa-Pro aminopeptidase|nr:Xaa-Pro peptidase family protein [Dysgonamonadaceae bacterium]